MVQIIKYYSIFLLIVLLPALTGCTEEDVVAKHHSNQVILNLPMDNVLDINTRVAVDDSRVNDILAIIIRNSKTECEKVSEFSVTADKIQLSLAKLNPQQGEKLYIFCNTGISTLIAVDENELFSNMTLTNSTNSGLIMYGISEISDAGNISVSLTRSLSKATLTAANGIVVNSWKICNVPSQGFVTGKQGYPANTDFTTEIVPGDDGVAYFVPRIDNSSATTPYTCLVAEISGRGWFRLDFYNGGNLDVTQKFSPINLAANDYYKFKITSINGNGYGTETEALANTGSNINYEMTVTEGHSSSNGQYTLLCDTDYILLYPVASTTNKTLEVLHLSAIIPENSTNNVTTYKVKLVNPSNQLQIVGGDTPTTLDLYENVVLTTANSKRTITLSFDGADTNDSYLEIQLGNIVRQIPIDVISSNCYLFDFSSNKTLYIPYIQANMDGNTRISSDMEIEPHILWSDQDNVSLSIIPNKEKQWLEVTNTGATFTGNVVIAATIGGEIKWSWHVWALDGSILEFDDVKGIFDFKSTNVIAYNQMKWMDRNLGTYNLTPNTAASRGLLYQWGRKDPFPGGADNPLEEPWLYTENGGKYQMNTDHPKWGANRIKITPTQAGSGNCLEYSISHPNRFLEGHEMYLTSGYGEWDWYSDKVEDRNNYLWISKGRKKTPYNPCPIGWTLPIGGLTSPWVGLWPTNGTLTADGLTWSNVGYYPFAPYRNDDSGLVWIPSGLAYYGWGDGDDSGLTGTVFYSDRIDYAVSMCRSWAQSLRCVRE